MTKYAGHAVTLDWDKAGGTTYQTIGQIIDMGGPSLARNAIDVSTRDSTNYWREFIKGFKDGGELTFTVVLDQTLASHGTATGFLGDFTDDSATMPNWKMTFPNSDEWSFDGFVTGSEAAEPLDDALTADITVKITGEPTLS